MGCKRDSILATGRYVENVAAAIALVVTDERATGRVYNVADIPVLSEAEWVCAIGRAAGWTGDVVEIAHDHLPVALRGWGNANMEQEWFTDTTRIRAELGYTEPVSPGEALRRTVAWERANPPTDIPPTLFDYAARPHCSIMPPRMLSWLPLERRMSDRATIHVR